MTATTYTVTVNGIGPVEVTVDEHGKGLPFLLLHGGGGPDTTGRFGERLASSGHLRVLNPIHPGFGGTPRPEALHTVGGLAAVYAALLDQLGLDGVTVAGNSIGGWIA
ncbi:MAG TPA: alpha/beta fold hydrolase, partial [Streptosporangiaceae bacterium]